MIFKTSQGDWDLIIPSNHHTVVLKMSGGADSAIMGYCMALYKKKERPDLKIIIATTNGFAPKTWHIRYANQVCDKITELTGVDFSDRHQNQMIVPEIMYRGSDFIEEIKLSNYDKAQKENEKNIMAREGDDAKQKTIWYNGTTANPPRSEKLFYEDYHKGFDTPNVMGHTECTVEEASNLYERDPEVKRRESGTKAGYRMWAIPFNNKDKKFIAELYKNLGVLDSLFPLTRSCENNQHYLPDPNNEKHCEKCWWCLERYWGFGRYV